MAVNKALRQRLIGALVLVSLAVVLWPLIFSDIIGPEVDRNSMIPPSPGFDKYQVSRPAKPEGLEPVSRYQPAPVVDVVEVVEKPTVAPAKPAPKTVAVENPKPVTKPSAKPALDANGLPVYWALKVGSFGNVDNAAKLKAKLVAGGYKVKTEQVKTAKGVAIRVYIGPKLDRRSLEKVQAEVDRQFKVNSKIQRFAL